MGEFEQYRDVLIQEISTSINSIVLNLNTLNRSLNNSIQVSKDFENVSELWANFYSGLNQQDVGETSEIQASEIQESDHDEEEIAEVPGEEEIAKSE